MHLLVCIGSTKTITQRNAVNNVQLYIALHIGVLGKNLQTKCQKVKGETLLFKIEMKQMCEEMDKKVPKCTILDQVEEDMSIRTFLSPCLNSP